MIKFFERFRKKKSCRDSEKNPLAVKKKSPAAPHKKSTSKKEKDLIKWK